MPTTTVVDTFKLDLLNKLHNFNGVSPDTFNMLLIKPDASGAYDNTLIAVGTPGSGTPSPTNVGTDEVTGTGYTSGGITMAGIATLLQSGVATVDWSTNPSWSSSTISAICVVLYNYTQGGRVVAVFDFGGTITSNNGSFTIDLPPSGYNTSILRLFTQSSGPG